MPPIYDYSAIEASGKKAKGIVEAENAKAARAKLKKQGLMVTDVTERNAAKPSGKSMQIPFIGGSIGQRHVSQMTRQLASLVKANIPLVEALNALVEQTEKEPLKVVLAQVRQDVNEGLSLARAMAKHPKVFDNIFINMVEAGESSGTLSLVLQRLAELKEAQMRLRGKITSGMMYPALMMAVAVVLLVVIFVWVIPKLTKVFESMNKPMPATTKFLIWTSDKLVNWWYLVFSGVGLVIWLFLRYIRSSTGKPKWDAFKLKAPVFGELTRMIAVTRFSLTMATLLGAGVPILTAMNIAKNLVGSIPIANAIANARENITEGQSIAEPLRRSGEFPPLVIHMIAIGEKTGELPDMLTNVASNYEEQVSTRIDGMTALLEPAMIVGMGGVVGFIVMSIFVPLLEISNIK